MEDKNYTIMKCFGQENTLTGFKTVLLGYALWRKNNERASKTARLLMQDTMDTQDVTRIELDDITEETAMELTRKKYPDAKAPPRDNPLWHELREIKIWGGFKAVDKLAQ